MSIASRTCILLFMLTSLATIGAMPAAAAPITISDCYTGGCDSVTGAVTVTVTDDVDNENNGTGDIKIVIENLTNGFIDEIGLMYQGGLATSSTIEQFTASHSTAPPSLSFTQCQNDNSGETLNLCFDFMNKNSARLQAGQSVTLFLDSPALPLWSTSLIATAAYTHIQGLPEGASAKLVDAAASLSTPAVPEPATLVLLGVAAAAVAVRQRRRREASSAEQAHSEADKPSLPRRK